MVTELTWEEMRGAELVFISDVHMVDPHDERGLLLRNLINDLGSLQISRLVLGGDIFEFCFGKKQYFRNKFNDLGTSLQNLKDAGSQIFLIQGNHEAFLETLNWSFAEMIKEKDLVLKLGREALKVVIAHGDLINPPSNYLTYTKIVRSQLFGMGLGLIPSRLLDQLALGFAEKSRAQDEYRELNHAKLLADGFRWVKGHGAAVGIFGHFHYPYESQDEGIKIICDWSWEAPNFIAYSSGKWLRGVWMDQRWKLLPIEFASGLGPSGDGSNISGVIAGC